MFFSTAQKDVQITPLHAKIPMKIVKLGVVGVLYSFIHAREPLYSNSAVIVCWLQWTRAQNSVPSC